MDSDLANLRGTLGDINELMSICDDAEKTNLSELKRNLEMMISLKELEGLTSVYSSDQDCHKANELIAKKDIFRNFQDDEIAGQKCSLPGWTSRGYFILQNAIVAEIVDAKQKSRHLRLFLANPTRVSDIPCDGFLTNGECCDGSLCRFSHGIVVPSEDVCGWHEPEPKLYLQEGQLCLALPQAAGTPLWRHAHIKHTDIKTGSCVVEFITPDVAASSVSLPFSHIFPITTNNESVPSTGLDRSVVVDGPIENADDFNAVYGDEIVEELHNIRFNRVEVVIPSEVPLVSGASTKTPDEEQSDASLGNWEVHTRGIGSRLLCKMGYDGIGGLGKSGTGRRLPVSVDMRLHQIDADLSRGRPQRPSIDLLVNMKSGGSMKTWRRQRPSRKAPNSSTPVPSQGEKRRFYTGSVFEFLNGHVFGRKATSSGASSEPTNQSAKTEKDLNIEIYSVQRKIHSLSREIARAEESLRRNEGRDRLVAEAAKRRLEEKTRQLRDLKRRESSLTAVVKKRQGDAKLRIF